MIKRSTWIVLIVLVVLAGALYAIQKTNLLAASESPTSTPVPMLLEQTTDTIVSVKLTDSAGKDIIAALNNSNQWTITEPAGLQISQGNMQEVLSDLDGISVQSSLLSSLPLTATGLDSPAHTITLTFKSGQVHVIKVGQLTPTQSGYYVQVDANTPVIAIQSNIDSVIELLTAVTYTPTPNSTATPVVSETATPPVSPGAILTETPGATPTP